MFICGGQLIKKHIPCAVVVLLPWVNHASAICSFHFTFQANCTHGHMGRQLKQAFRFKCLLDAVITYFFLIIIKLCRWWATDALWLLKYAQVKEHIALFPGILRMHIFGELSVVSLSLFVHLLPRSTNWVAIVNQSRKTAARIESSK